MSDRDAGSAILASPARGTNSSSPSVNHKRNTRKSKHHSQFSLDGSVSDTSVPNTTASQRSPYKHGPKQNNNMGGMQVQQNGNISHTIPDTQRIASGGGDLLQATPAKERAYAGPTFQASPAASSLPLPKFFSRSTSLGPPPPSLHGRLAGDGMSEGGESSPEPDIVPSEIPPRNTQKSPLDMFFAADKAERENHRRSSGSLSPEAVFRRPKQPSGSADVSNQSPRNTHLTELHGEKGNQTQPQTMQPASRLPSSQEDDRQLYTKSLMDLLFNTSVSPMSTPPHTRNGASSGAHTPNSTYYTPPAFHGGTPGSITQMGSSEPPNHNSLHYGNRNLSSLFKDARAETPPRPSSLRQEVASDHPFTSNSSAAFPSRPFRPSTSEVNETSFAKIQHDRLPHNPSQPQISNNVQKTPIPDSTSGSVSQSAFVSRGISEQATTSSASPRTGATRDVKTMEDDLRRMLKLNV